MSAVLGDSSYISLKGARQNNLKNIDLKIPKNKFVVFCGVSGSGKSSLVFDTLGRESLRQLQDSLPSFIKNFMPTISRPDFDLLEGLPVAIVVAQQNVGSNNDNTLGTITDIQPLLRNIFAQYGIPKLDKPDAFSFNSPLGMCSKCSGRGEVLTIDTDKFIDKSKSLKEGALKPYPFAVGTWVLKNYIDYENFDPDKKIEDFTKEELELLLYGTSRANVEMPENIEGVFERFQRLYINKASSLSKKAAKMLTEFTTKEECPRCKGARLSQSALSCLLGGKNIAEYSSMEIEDLLDSLLSQEEKIARSASWERLQQQLEYLIKLGLGYLSLDRTVRSLSGGEVRRASIVRHLSSTLSDIAYILDEPTAGLHPADVDTLIELLDEIKTGGNSIFVVEHNLAIINFADHLIELGPGSGIDGGKVIFSGSLDDIKKQNSSPTARSMGDRIELNAQPSIGDEWLEIDGITAHNLEDVSIKIPKFAMTVVTGVAGSGKTTLMREFSKKMTTKQTIYIDQIPISSSRRSVIATYMGIMEHVRNIFARSTGIASGNFSFNSSGACQKCRGLGSIDEGGSGILQSCPACSGMRYNSDILEYTLMGLNINDVLNLTVDEAINFFSGYNELRFLMENLKVAGLSYVTLGQSIPTLSGGESQRLKLASALCTKSDIYILDEPTTGLHMADIDRFLKSISDMIHTYGCTIIVIEHDLQTVASADWIIDVGPGAGNRGGKIVYQGTPKDIVNYTMSVTGNYLRSTIK